MLLEPDTDDLPNTTSPTTISTAATTPPTSPTDPSASEEVSTRLTWRTTVNFEEVIAKSGILTVALNMSQSTEVTTLPASNTSDTPNNESPAHWPELNLSFGTWATIVSCVVLFWIGLSLFLAYFFGPDFVTCYLCEQQIPRRYWLSGEHRIECANEHERFLDKLPAPFPSSRCPICYHPLKLWPKQLGPPEFMCSSNKKCTEMANDGVTKKSMDNAGDNRYNCFNCDFDLCIDCILNGGNSFGDAPAEADIQRHKNITSQHGHGDNGWVNVGAEFDPSVSPIEELSPQMEIEASHRAESEPSSQKIVTTPRRSLDSKPTPGSEHLRSPGGGLQQYPYQETSRF